ncbi:MAG: TOMM system kinase/cyclase fusion protein [Crocinitomicaceae bacterium]|nr:TOMM system kinase/cyclase fusion protein [Flavobacteriales bacterium]NQZ37841.1 TOMM system kinase/cyclase fusion protein [Crocinitomicaceae bacterium]
MINFQLIDSDINLAANYRYLEKIGEGGYGIVYKAEQISTGQIVAIKVVKTLENTTNEKRKQQLARFEREARLCAELNHPNIVKLIDKGETDQGEPNVVFEYVEGETLKAFILRKKNLSATEMAPLMGQVLDALVYVHSKGIVHRDLKPQNIIISQIGAKNHVKILDFGIGAFTHDFRTTDYRNLTVTQDVLGTPTYSAPEQLRGEPPTTKSDLYAWGLIVIECLTGKPVMDGGSIAEVFQQQLMSSNVPIPPSIVGHDLAHLLRKVLEKNPRNRAQETQTIAEKFEEINFNTLTGIIEEQKKIVDDDSGTLANNMVWSATTGARKQLTVLCFRLNLVPSKGVQLDLEILDAIQKDQLNLCKDTAIRYGGYVSGTFMNNLAVYYGYPETSDTDARRAGRTALELVIEANKRSALLMKQHGIRIDLQIGIHSGTTLIQRNHLPEGNVPNISFDLMQGASSGTVQVSAPTKKLLDPFLEFEKAKELSLSEDSESMIIYKLIGERETEALSSLRPRSANREMVGRELEKVTLLESWKQTNERGNAVIVNGQAGIGKSKLSYEIKKIVRTLGNVVRECRCLPEHQNNALYPFLKMLRNHWGITDLIDKDKVVARLKEVLEEANCTLDVNLPLLCSWLSISLPEEYTLSEAAPEEQKKLLFQLLKQCLLNFDQENPFLLVVEDLHWLDPTSKEFIEYLLTDLKEQQYMLLMTARPEFENSWDKECLLEIDLEILSNDSLKALIQGNLEGKSISKKALTYISERADGIPFFAEELTQMLLERKYIIASNKVYDLVEDIDTKSIPITLQDLLNARLDSLSMAKETAQLAAAIGREFNYELLTKASVKDEASVQSDLEMLINADLIYHQRRIQSGNYIFRHALIRDAAYDSMPSSMQQDSHGRIATVLENDYPEKVNEHPFRLAQHLGSASQYSRAIEYAFTAIQKRIEGSLNNEAFGLYKITQSWVQSIEGELERKETELQLNINMLPVYTITHGWGTEEFESLVIKNNKLIDEIRLLQPDYENKAIEEQVLKSEWMLFSNYHSQMKQEETLALGNEILDQLKKVDDHRLKMAVSAFMGQAYINDGAFAQAMDMFESVMRESEARQDFQIHLEYGFDPCVHSLGLMGLVEYILGYPDKAMSYAEKGVEYAKGLDNAMTVAVASLFASLLTALLSDVANTKKILSELYEAYENEVANSFVEKVIFLVDDWVKGDTQRAEESLQMFLDVGQHNSLSWYEPLLVETLLNNGDSKKAKELLFASIKRSTKNGENYAFSILNRLLALACFKQSNLISGEVEAYFKTAITTAKNQNTVWLELHATYDYCNLLMAGGNSEKAKQLLSPIFKRIKEGFETDLYIKAKALLK